MELKTKRKIMYFVIFCFVCYFQADILINCNEMTKEELNLQENNNNLDKLGNFDYNNVNIIEYSKSYSSYIRNIANDIMQIVYLIAVYLVIYIHEIHSKNEIKKP